MKGDMMVYGRCRVGDSTHGGHDQRCLSSLDGYYSKFQSEYDEMERHVLRDLIKSLMTQQQRPTLSAPRTASRLATTTTVTHTGKTHLDSAEEVTSWFLTYGPFSTVATMPRGATGPRARLSSLPLSVPRLISLPSLLCLSTSVALPSPSPFLTPNHHLQHASLALVNHSFLFHRHPPHFANVLLLPGSPPTFSHSTRTPFYSPYSGVVASQHTSPQ